MSLDNQNENKNFQILLPKAQNVKLLLQNYKRQKENPAKV
jgi:hypothetical protein